MLAKPALNMSGIACNSHHRSGGVANGQDALEYLMAGAAAVQVGTANLTEPQASLRVLEEIEQLLQEMQVRSIKEIAGKELVGKTQSTQ